MSVDDYTYTIRKMSEGHYEVAKWGDSAEPTDLYDVTFKDINNEQGLWCNCLGFRRQTYPKKEHKHVCLVRRFIKDGEPGGRVYKLVGGPQDPDVTVVNDSILPDELRLDR